MKRLNFELNVTLRCNLKCANCNRHCHLRPQWAEDSDMTLEQVDRFVEALATGPIKAKRVKIAGGEPLLHHDLPGVLEILLGGVAEGLIDKIKVDSNGTLPRPAVAEHPALRWSGRRPARKVHLPTLWSPTDLGLPTVFPCSMPRRCGISLDNRGYLPCSMAISIVRTMRLPGVYRSRPDEPGCWDFAHLCRHCVFAAPEAWRAAHCKPLNQITAGEKLPTESWRAAMQRGP